MYKKVFRFGGGGSNLSGNVTKNKKAGVWQYDFTPWGYLREYLKNNNVMNKLTQQTIHNNPKSKIFGITNWQLCVSHYNLQPQNVTGYYYNDTASLVDTKSLYNGQFADTVYQGGLWLVGWFWYESQQQNDNDPELTVLPTKGNTDNLGPDILVDGYQIYQYPYICTQHLNKLGNIIKAYPWDDETGEGGPNNSHNFGQYFNSYNGRGSYTIHYIDNIYLNPKNARLTHNTNPLDSTQENYFLQKLNDNNVYLQGDNRLKANTYLDFKMPVTWGPNLDPYYHINDLNCYVIGYHDRVLLNRSGVFGNKTIEALDLPYNLYWAGFVVCAQPYDELRGVEL